MNAELSRRVGRLMNTRTILMDTPSHKRNQLADAVASAPDFESLPNDLKEIVTKAEEELKPEPRVKSGQHSNKLNWESKES